MFAPPFWPTPPPLRLGSSQPRAEIAQEVMGTRRSTHVRVVGLPSRSGRAVEEVSPRPLTPTDPTISGRCPAHSRRAGGSAVKPDTSG
jgi:hypothetical protein